MCAIQELIEVADRLCKNLEIAANNEKIYSTNICIELEKYSWETYRMMNDIKEIQEYIGK